MSKPVTVLNAHLDPVIAEGLNVLCNDVDAGMRPRSKRSVLEEAITALLNTYGFHRCDRCEKWRRDTTNYEDSTLCGSCVNDLEHGVEPEE